MTLSPEALKAAREAIGTGEISWPDVVAAIEVYNAAFFAESAKNSPEIAELVERLTPHWAVDEEITRAAAKPDNGIREIVTDYLVKNNALKAEAASALTVLSRRAEAAEAEVERLTPLAVAYDYLESPARADIAEARLAKAVEALRHILRCEYEGPGLHDCIDNTGTPYQSQYLANRIAAALAIVQEIDHGE